MTARARSRKRVAKTRLPRRSLIWGSATKGKGIAIERTGHRKKDGNYWWNVLHLKDGKVVLVHRDYPSLRQAVEEAESYARYESKRPRDGFIR